MHIQTSSERGEFSSRWGFILAALTSSISMLEVPVAYVIESEHLSRTQAALLVALAVGSVCAFIIFNFELVFGLIVSLTTEYGQPLLGLFLAVYTAWVWSRDKVLKELQQGFNSLDRASFGEYGRSI